MNQMPERRALPLLTDAPSACSEKGRRGRGPDEGPRESVGAVSREEAVPL